MHNTMNICSKYKLKKYFQDKNERFFSRAIIQCGSHQDHTTDKTPLKVKNHST